MYQKVNDPELLVNNLWRLPVAIAIVSYRHCEARSAVAIHTGEMDYFA
jgi:hypothetical protein